ncbi:MAG: hypothetical protein HND46_23830 [Chloroflexi bacterium]|nr:hypothetical protein [Chloroflexota bacterium]
MIEVKIYVEGPSDEAAMRALLQPLIERKQAEGISIDFFEAPPGHKKNPFWKKCRFAPLISCETIRMR